MKRIFFIILLLPVLSCESKNEEGTSEKIIAADSHVHLMSPFLIEYWKSLGIQTLTVF